MVPTRAGIFGF
jgi:hypothetical protein